MTKKDLRIIFMGTPEFAVESLKRLVEGGYNVVAVVTQPDKPVGRHQDTLQPSQVKLYAVEHGLPVLQPVKMKDPDFLEQLKSYQADLQVVVAFRMLPEVVWAMPKFGTFNVHAALLPQYRGAAPINWAVINGETETGVTTFFLDHDILHPDDESHHPHGAQSHRGYREAERGPIMTRLEEACAAAIEDPDFVTFMNNNGQAISYLDAQGYADYLKQAAVDVAAAMDAVGL